MEPPLSSFAHIILSALDLSERPVQNVHSLFHLILGDDQRRLNPQDIVKHAPEADQQALAETEVPHFLRFFGSRGF